MKTKLLAILLFLAFSAALNPVSAQQEITVVDSSADGTIKFALVKSQSKSALREESKALLKRVLKAGKGADFYLYKVVADELGMTHEKYQQTFNGVKVEFGEFIVHKDKSGNIVSINGDYSPIPESFGVNPKLEFRDALSKAALLRKQAKYSVHKLPKEESVERSLTRSDDEFEVVAVKGDDQQLHLAYKANLTGENIFDSFYGYVDCETGKMVFVQPLAYPTNAPGTAATRYSGSQPIMANSYSGGYRLAEVSRGGTSTAIQTLNFNRAPAAYVSDIDNGIANASDFLDNDNSWTAAEYNNANKDNAALDAHWAAEKTFDYFKALHGRVSYDDRNGAIKCYVHVNTRDNNGNVVSMDNAFWLDTKKSLFFGDGLYYKPLVSVDIVAHEIGHGICKSSVGNGAGLVYANESGALNESLSDIWGACVEQWATTGKQTWIEGEEITWGGLRSMSNPKSLGQPSTYQSQTYWVNVNGCIPSNANDKCGVHTNSGVGNYWFYLLSQGGSGSNDLGNAYTVKGIGITSAARIVYMMETSFLLANSGYSVARSASINAATNLFGANSCEVISVTNAWYAVGVGAPFQAANVSIAGSEYICSSGATYTVSNLPAGCTVSWSGSGNLTLSSASGNSAKFVPNGRGNGTITATINRLECGYSIEKSIVVGAPKPNIAGPMEPNYIHCIGNSVSFQVFPYLPEATSYQWYLSGDDLEIPVSKKRTASVACQNSGMHSVTVMQYIPGCGWSDFAEKSFEVAPCGAASNIILYPNPAGSSITLTLQEQGRAAESVALPMRAASNSVQDYSLAIYNTQNQLVKQASGLCSGSSLSVADLPEGMYVVHIIVGSTTQRQMLQIKR